MLAGAGIRWVRMDFKWDLTELEKGKFDFAPSSFSITGIHFMTAARRPGLKPRARPLRVGPRPQPNILPAGA